MPFLIQTYFHLILIVHTKNLRLYKYKMYYLLIQHQLCHRKQYEVQPHDVLLSILLFCPKEFLVINFLLELFFLNLL